MLNHEGYGETSKTDRSAAQVFSGVDLVTGCCLAQFGLDTNRHAYKRESTGNIPAQNRKKNDSLRLNHFSPLAGCLADAGFRSGWGQFCGRQIPFLLRLCVTHEQTLQQHRQATNAEPLYWTNHLITGMQSYHVVSVVIFAETRLDHIGPRSKH